MILLEAIPMEKGACDSSGMKQVVRVTAKEKGRKVLQMSIFKSLSERRETLILAISHESL